MARGGLDDVVVARLKTEMRRRGESANSLAKKCKRAGYSTGQTTISAILRGTQSARVETLEKLADILGIDPWLLLTEPGAIESILARAARPAHGESATMHRLEPPDYGPILEERFQPRAERQNQRKDVRKRTNQRQKASAHGAKKQNKA